MKADAFTIFAGIITAPGREPELERTQISLRVLPFAWSVVCRADSTPAAERDAHADLWRKAIEHRADWLLVLADDFEPVLGTDEPALRRFLGAAAAHQVSVACLGDRRQRRNGVSYSLAGHTVQALGRGARAMNALAIRARCLPRMLEILFVTRHLPAALFGWLPRPWRGCWLEEPLFIRRPG